MIKTEIKDGVAHIYSDQGKPLLQKDTGLTFREAYERVDGVRHEYEEAE